LPRRGHLADVITDLRMAAGTQPILAGQPAVLMTVRGGNYRPGTPREGWDHATGWMRRISPTSNALT
jgi:FMN-dependent NADH-azoreductase